MAKKKVAASARKEKSSTWSRLPWPIRYALPWVTAATAFIVLVINLDKASPIWDRWQFASHEWVVHKVDKAKDDIKKDIENNSRDLKNTIDGTNYILRDMQIEQAQGKLDANNDAMTKWKVELGKTQDEQTRSMIEGTIRDLNLRVRALNAQLNDLTSARARAH